MFDFSALIQKATEWFDGDQRPTDAAAPASRSAFEADAPLSQVGFDGEIPAVDPLALAAVSKAGSST